MILVLGGTTEGRQLGKFLQDRGFKVLLTTTSSHGRYLARQGGVSNVSGKALDAHELKLLLLNEQIRAVIDATHPFAQKISELAVEACAEMEVPYARYERKAADLPEHPLLVRVPDFEQAVPRTAALGTNIFLTIGSRKLGLFCQAPEMCNKRIIARVLPEAEVIKHCRELGLKPDQLAALQGPFSREANRWMFEHFRAEVVVAKASGEIGGQDTKWEVCLELGLPLVVVERPKLDYPLLLARPEEVLTFLKGVVTRCRVEL